MSRFININMNMTNARMTYIIKRRKYACGRSSFNLFILFSFLQGMQKERIEWTRLTRNESQPAGWIVAQTIWQKGKGDVVCWNLSTYGGITLLRFLDYSSAPSSTYPLAPNNNRPCAHFACKEKLSWSMEGARLLEKYKQQNGFCGFPPCNQLEQLSIEDFEAHMNTFVD